MFAGIRNGKLNYLGEVVRADGLTGEGQGMGGMKGVIACTMKIRMSHKCSCDTKPNSGVLHPLLGGAAVFSDKEINERGG